MNKKDQIKRITIGKAIFKSLPSKIKQNIQKYEEVQSTLNRNYWGINLKKYFKHNWKQLFQQMSECLAEQINLNNNDRVQILKQIQNVSYTNLKTLYLDYNKINNIQPLISINFQHLTNLSLHYNQICQIKCLNKLSVSSLKLIALYKNPLIEINALTRSKISPKKLKWICLQYFSISDIVHQDLGLLVKLNSQSAEDIYIKSNKRIRQTKVQSMLQLRFLQIKSYKSQKN